MSLKSTRSHHNQLVALNISSSRNSSFGGGYSYSDDDIITATTTETSKEATMVQFNHGLWMIGTALILAFLLICLIRLFNRYYYTVHYYYVSSSNSMDIPPRIKNQRRKQLEQELRVKIWCEQIESCPDDISICTCSHQEPDNNDTNINNNVEGENNYDRYARREVSTSIEVPRDDTIKAKIMHTETKSSSSLTIPQGDGADYNRMNNISKEDQAPSSCACCSKEITTTDVVDSRRNHKEDHTIINDDGDGRHTRSNIDNESQFSSTSSSSVTTSKNNPKCAICLAHFCTGELICESTNPTCIHIFHKDCMNVWLLLNARCPICREVYLEQ